MKALVVLIYALSLSALTGCTLGDHLTDHDCSHAHEREAKSLHDILAEGLDKCFGKVDNHDNETLNSPDKELQDYFRGFAQYCPKKDLIEDCLSKRTADASMCLNGTEDVTLRFVEDTLKSALNYGCVVGGHRIKYVTSVVYYLNNSTWERNYFTDCVATAKSTGIESNTLDASTRLLGFYREFKVFKQCLVDRMRGHYRAVFNAQLILNGILRSMKCPQQEDGTTSLCETLDTTPSTEESVCPYSGRDEDTPPRIEYFIEFANECVELYFLHLNFDNLKTFTAIEEFRSFFKMYCDHLPSTVNCIRDISSNAKVCLNVTSDQVFEMYAYFIEYTLETGCKQDGSNAATIFNGIFNREEQAVMLGRIAECTDAAVLVFKRKTTEDNSLQMKLLQVYRAVSSIKQCVLDHATDVNSFKTVFATLVDDVLGAAKCVNLVDGTIVLCQTLTNI